MASGRWITRLAESSPRGAGMGCALWAGPAAGRARVRQARVPHAGHRAHGSGAAGRGGAGAAASEGHFLRGQRAHQGGRRQPGTPIGRPGGRPVRPKGMNSLPTPGTTSIGAATCRDAAAISRARIGRPRRGRATSSGQRRNTASKSTRRPSVCTKSRAKSRCRCFALRAARPRRRSCRPPKPVGTNMWPGRRPVSWATSCPVKRPATQALLKKALRDVRSGDILVAHLGIWSRKDPWAPAVLEPLIVGLKEKGFCFSTLARSPGLSRLDCKDALTMDWIERSFLLCAAVAVRNADAAGDVRAGPGQFARGRLRRQRLVAGGPDPDRRAGRCDRPACSACGRWSP